MSASRLEILVEELSAERALKVLMPRLAPGVDHEVRTFNGKPDLLRKLPQRMKGYASWASGAGIGIVILVDRDADDCRRLKAGMEQVVGAAGLATLSTAHDPSLALVATRIACEELEAWFLGDVPALVQAFPRLPSSLGDKAAFRDPDGVSGGTAEALERALQEHGYQQAGLEKCATADRVAQHMDVENNRSASFRTFRDGVRRLVGKDLCATP